MRVFGIYIRFPLPNSFLCTMVLPLNQYQRYDFIPEDLLLTIQYLNCILHHGQILPKLFWLNWYDLGYICQALPEH